MTNFKNRWVILLFCWSLICVGCNMPLKAVEPFVGETVVEDGEGVGNSADRPQSENTVPNNPTNESDLRLAYEIQWRVDPTDPGYALASVRLNATGGDGFYTFFRDETLTNSAYFSYRWSSCIDNLGTFRVESGDGQAATLEYFEQPPCPDRRPSEVSNP